MLDAKEFCTFRLQDLLFGIEVSKVQEVLRHHAMTAVPLAPAVFSGLINLRGQIVTAVDLRRRLGLEARAADVLPMNIVVRCEDGVVSLLVDEIGDVVEVSQEQFEPSPDTLQGEARQLIDGVYKLKRGLLHLMNLQRVMRLQPGETAADGKQWEQSLPVTA
jgi:purine-binding chemotaxis protein CheW